MVFVWSQLTRSVESYVLKVPHRIPAPCALIGTSNFFEFALAGATRLFGLNSGAASATVVRVLVEVPVILSLSPLPITHGHLSNRRSKPKAIQSSQLALAFCPGSTA
jgi:ACR3 family arsenite efflux pump ArsB